MAGLVDGIMAAWLQAIVSRRREQAGLLPARWPRAPPGKRAAGAHWHQAGTGLQLRAIHDIHPR